MTRARSERFAPWAGMVVAAGCLALNQQGFSSMLHFNCHLGSPTKGVVSFVVLAIFLVASGLVSWRWRGDTEQVRFVAMMSVGAAALVFLAIAFQTAATLILPGCGA